MVRKMRYAKVTSKGQVTIPVEVRRRLRIDVGDCIKFVENADGEFMIKPVKVDVRSLKGLLKKPATPVSVEAMRYVIRSSRKKN